MRAAGELRERVRVEPDLVQEFDQNLRFRVQGLGISHVRPLGCAKPGSRFPAKMEQQIFDVTVPEIHGHDLALTVLHVPYSLDR